MRREIIDDNWEIIREEIRSTWADLTEDELENVEGNLDKLYGLMREKYGKSPDELDAYLASLGY